MKNWSCHNQRAIWVISSKAKLLLMDLLLGLPVTHILGLSMGDSFKQKLFPIPLGILHNTSSAVYMHNCQCLRNTGQKAFSDFPLINKTDEINSTELPGLVTVSEKLSQRERNHVFKWYCSL